MIALAAPADAVGPIAHDGAWASGGALPAPAAPLPPPLIASWTAQRLDSGDVAFQLSAGYQMQLAAIDRTLTLIDVARDTRTTISSNATIATDAGSIGAFHAPISLELADGTLVTITTAAASADAVAATAIKGFVATRDAMAMQVASLSDALFDPIAATRVSTDGDAVDEAQRDGLVLKQDRGGWVQEDGVTRADAAYLDQTAPGGRFGGDDPMLSDRELVRVIHRIIAFAGLGQSLSFAWRGPDSRDDRPRDTVERNLSRHGEEQRIADRAALHRRMIATGPMVATG